MLKQNYFHGCSHQTLAFSHKPILSSIPIPCYKKNYMLANKVSRKIPTLLRRWRSSSPSSIKAISTFIPSTYTIKVQVFVSPIVNPLLPDQLLDTFGKPIHIDLVAANLDPKTKEEKPLIGEYVQKKSSSGDTNQYEADLIVPGDFGVIGAVLVQNEYSVEIFVKNVVLSGASIGENVGFSCESWVQPKLNNTDIKSKRVFFNNKSFLPSETPSGIKSYRENELKIIRTEDNRERKFTDRIYDYDVYNDLGDPDADKALKRRVLGGEYPFPRRCRTGRPKCITDPKSESRSSNVYVPRDETFSAVKQESFQKGQMLALLNGLIPRLEATLDGNHGFSSFTAIDNLFGEGLPLLNFPKELGFLQDLLPRIVNVEEGILKFQMPEMMDRDKFSWLSNSEFGRQTLAGINPCRIRLVQEWPIKSIGTTDVKWGTLELGNMDRFGPLESEIPKDIVEKEIGEMTVEEAINQKKLFVLDYYDVLIPFVEMVRELEGRTLYASRTLFFLTPEGTLRPLAIELAVPPIDGKPYWRKVFVDSPDANNTWLWRLAKAHVLSHDMGFHQLVTHLLRTHVCTEPYIIASHRCLSAMHPIYRLLHPHFRYTMEINALARLNLINAGGVVESTFFPGKYSMEVSSIAYTFLWQFDKEALPEDLIHRGMAVKDDDGNLKLTIEDYPYAADGLLIWDAIKQWVTDYVTHYYNDDKTDKSVNSDTELQAWWSEIKNVGHGDKKDQPWWPNLNSCNDLIGILTTIIWVASGQHAAVNFGQYPFAGYFPNRPSIVRTKMPNEDGTETELKKLMEKPEELLLDCLPTQVQAVSVMGTLDILSTHSPDEEYLGNDMEPFYEDDKIIKAKFEIFRGRLMVIEGIINERNATERLLNRRGAGVVPYELLKPSSGPGVTGKGIPKSISI